MPALSARLEIPVIPNSPTVPIEIFFNPENPTLHYRSAFAQGVIPISAYDMQKAIYEKGQRYIKKWNIKTKATNAEKSATVLMGVFLLILAVIGGYLLLTKR